MDQTAILASLHLHAVLPNLAKVATYDPTAKDIVGKWRGKIQFSILAGPSIHFIFDQGKVTAIRGKTSLPKLWIIFFTSEQANKMFTGKGTALPAIWGLWHPLMLRGILKLSHILEEYLQPSPKALADPAVKRFIVNLTLDTITNGVEILSRMEPRAREYAMASPKGTVEFRILPGGPVKRLTHLGDGQLALADGAVVRPNAIMEFKDIDTAWALFNDELDVMAAIGTGDIRLRGLIPLVDSIAAIMDILSHYLE